MSKYLQVSREKGLLIIQLNRPDKKNALTGEIYTGLAALFQHADTDDTTRVVLIHGGDDFSAGNDLKDFLEQPGDFLTSPAGSFLLAVTEFNKPIIAAVDGYAVGIGTTLLLHCDLVYCSERATFMLPFINLGLVPEFAATLLLPQTAGYHLAAELLLLGEPFDAKTAVRAGLVNAVFDSDQLLDHARDIAQKLADKPVDALRQTRTLLRTAPESIHDRIIREANIFTTLLDSDDAVAAMEAILNKSGKS
ncbi:enoyl-CoA hydratase-related protein [Porticoccus sp.]